MPIHYIDQLKDLKGKKVFIRVDFNVPQDEKGNITEASRIIGALPTIRYAVEQGAKVVLASHLGRPKGEKKPKYTMAPATKRLSQLLGKKVIQAPDCFGPEVDRIIAAMKPGDVVMLENVRFYPGEEKNDTDFARQLANGCEIYVNDAFAVSHRAHASVEAITRVIPTIAAGFLMKNEMTFFDKAMSNPVRPLVAILGGAKVSGKLELLSNLVKKVDILIIGGGMANTFLFAEGKAVGKSLCEKDLADTARAILTAGRAAKCQILLPVDAAVAKELKPHAPSRFVDVDHVGTDEMILDIGPKSIEAVEEALGRVKTLVWNGPFGAFETPPFDAATMQIAKTAAFLTVDAKLKSVAGGGDTVAALNAAGVAEEFTYVSTAGGAFLEWMEGKALPGVEALRA